jgi:hypothetical protein
MSGKHLTFDPAAWTGPTTLAWPDPNDHSYPVALSARTSLVKSFLVPFASVLVLGASLVALLASKPEAPGSLFGLFATLIVAAILCAGGFWRACQIARKNEPLIELSARGLSYPSFLGKTVPWSEIHDVCRVSAFLRSAGSGPPGVRIKIRDMDRFEPKWPKTILGLEVGGTRLDFVPLPTLLDVSQRQLQRAIEAHRAHFGRGGRPPPTPAELHAAAA